MTEYAVSVKDLSVAYGSSLVLDRLCFDLPKEGLLAILGPNGAGKTTLIKLLMGLIKPRQGSALVLGSPSGCHDPSLVSYVPQIKDLDRSFPALAEELVASGLRRRWPWRLTKEERRLSRETLELLGVGHLAERPLGELSGGQLQRVYLARGLVRKPELLVFDEPATGIDAPGETLLYQLIDDYREEHEAAVVMITHDWSVARHHASHVLMLNVQQISYGPPQEALTDEVLRLTFGHSGHRHSMSVLGKG
jgi:zinc transport system ATP-binding protein